jgi:predicted enzyme related to lactoylglutathione lyase
MAPALKTVIYPVHDLDQAKSMFRRLLAGVDPVMDESYYVQFNLGGLEIGLDPNGHHKGMTAPVVYWHVEDIKQTVAELVEAGAEEQQAVSDVGGGRRLATLTDADGNTIGLIQPV